MVLLATLLMVALGRLLVALLVVLLINLDPSEVTLLATVTVLDQTIFLLSSSGLLSRNNTVKLILDQILPSKTTTGSLSSSIVHLTTTSLSKHCYACNGENKLHKSISYWPSITTRRSSITAKLIYYLSF